MKNIYLLTHPKPEILFHQSQETTAPLKRVGSSQQANQLRSLPIEVFELDLEFAIAGGAIVSTFELQLPYVLSKVIGLLRGISQL